MFVIHKVAADVAEKALLLLVHCEHKLQRVAARRLSLPMCDSSFYRQFSCSGGDAIWASAFR